MKVLLTGAKGNFGQEFIKQSDAEVVQLTRDDWGRLDALCACGIDVVIHAASDLHCLAADAPVELIDSNLSSTARLLEAMRRNRIPRLVFLSSCAVYGDDMRTGEDERLCPASINGISKLLNEKIIADFCIAHGIKFEILRIFNMYGGEDHFSILSHLVRAIKDGTPFTLNNLGLAQRDFIHVSDVVAIVRQLMRISIPYTHLNIGTGVATKISTLVELVAKRHPNLIVQHRKARETEYSRADITRLREFIKMEFIGIEDYLTDHFPISERA